MRLNSKHIRGHIAGLVLVLSLTGSIATPVAAAPAPAAVHIDNFGKINDRYYRGAQPKGDDFRALSSMGIKTIIDLAAEGDPAEGAHAKAAGMNFVRIPMTTREVPSPAVIAQFMSLVGDPANQPVYVHCIGGRHRTGVMTAIYRMTIDKWTPIQALQEMKRFKFGADFLHPEFKAFVDAYVAPAPGATVGR